MKYPETLSWFQNLTNRELLLALEQAPQRPIVQDLARRLRKAITPHIEEAVDPNFWRDKFKE